ncbi:hypothetical protein [Entomohabitans teleogrylli]|uniref:hypothetical protein n=1 Tax=Entomohabitans teleogrylli TaxID=1384589 RepID=UPI0012B6A3B5|nr:hypothetical protein [Entomohabitans teleogrylli]
MTTVTSPLPGRSEILFDRMAILVLAALLICWLVLIFDINGVNAPLMAWLDMIEDAVKSRWPWQTG